MSVTNIIEVALNNRKTVEIKDSLFQYDYGQILKITDLQEMGIISPYQVYFSNDLKTGVAKPQIGDTDGVKIPDEYLQTGKPVYAFFYLHHGDSDGRTVHVVKIPVISRVAPLDEVPTEVEQSALNQAIAAIQEAAETLGMSEELINEKVYEATGTILEGYLENDQLGALLIQDGTLERQKVDSDFETTLTKADNAWQKNISETSIPTEGSWEATYDPLGYKQDIFSFIITRNNSLLNRLRGTAASDNISFSFTDKENDVHSFVGLDNVIQGLYTWAATYSKNYTDAKFTTYSPISIEIVTQEELDSLMTGVGNPNTFYLVPRNGDGGYFNYEKYWYVNNSWDTFGSSSTVIVESLQDVETPTGDTDYIVGTGTDYQYYKYINNEWELISGSSSQIFESIPFTYNGVQDTSSNTIFFNGVPTSNDSLNGMDIAIDVTTMMVYVSEIIVNPSSPTTFSWVNCGSFIPNPSATKDYYIIEGGTSFAHFRYIDDAFIRVGGNSYSKSEVDGMILTLQSTVSSLSSTVSGLVSQMNNLGNLVKDVTINEAKTALTVIYKDDSTTTIELDTGVDIDSTLYNIDGDYTLHFYDSHGNELEDLSVFIQGGGGGGETGGTASIGRITAPNVQTIYGDPCEIEYTVIAADSSSEGVGDGVGTLYVNNVPVRTGFVVSTSVTGASNTIEVGDYLSIGSNAVKISVSVDTGGESNSVATKTWTVNAINMYLVWNYNDSQANLSAVTDYFTPYGALNKTTYTFIDVEPVGFNPLIVTELPDTTAQDFDANDVIGINYFIYDSDEDEYTHYVWDTTTSAFVEGIGNIFNVNTTTRSGVQQALTIPFQSHGSHAVVRYMVGIVNGVEIKTALQVHDMVFVDPTDSTPIIATSFNTAKMMQYNTASIPIVVYNPASTTTTVILAENGNIVSTWTGVDRTAHYWNYSPTTYGTKILTITCGSVTKTITIEVEELDIDEQEVTGYDFRFKASEMATNAAVQAWSSNYTPVGSNVPQTVSATFSNNFDWVNGGLHTETDENDHVRQYFCVRAGTTMTLNYNLFGQTYDPKQYGKTFKFIFKAVNCRTYDANVLTCMDTSNGNNGVGLVMTANEATLSTANNSITTYYCKDSYIEFEFNIHPASEYRYLQFWMDGSHDTNKLYDMSDSMQQNAPVGITIGSPNCDVYIYMIKAYPTYLTNTNMLSNFIMDAPNAYEMVSRYERNDILNASGEIDYQKLANANPDLHVLALDINRISTGKKDNVVAYSVRHICQAGGAIHCFTIPNACITIQGTSSVGYLESAGNVDINMKYNRTFTSDNVEYTTGMISFDDGSTSTSGYAMTANSIPVDYMNVKVNVASSENANNACIADWYNTYQPWTSYVRRKKAKARDTMEFVPGAIFIRDRSGGLFGDTNSYHFYGICDLGNSKKNTKVFHDNTNPLATCMEVSNNTSLPCLMSSNDYFWNADDDAVTQELQDGELKEQKVFEFRYVADGMESVVETAWDRFVDFMVTWNPNLATNNALSESVTFSNYTFKGSGTFDTSDFDDDNVVYLYGYGTPTEYNGGMYAASDYITDSSADISYYYINYSNNYIYSSNGTVWTPIQVLIWTLDRNSVLAGISIDTYAGTYTTDSFNYRMAYILEHCEEYMVIDPVIYHFIFIESFLMTDNVAKNTFWSSDDLVHWEPSKNYDNDTSLGNDNVGGLSFTYGLETDDTVGSSYVFNAHDAAWITFARNLYPANQAMYRNRESAGCFNTTNFLKKLKDWQDTRPERVWIADAQRKYLRPYEDNGTETYLPMLAGRKTHQREQVKTYNAYYYASKYVSDMCTSQNIMVRGNTPTSGTSITVVPPANTATLSMYINCYINIASTSYAVVARTKAIRGQTYTLDFSTIGSMGETELYFCSAPMITELSGLAHLYFKQNNFAMGTNIQRLEIGSSVEGYENPNLQGLTIGNNRMLEYLDVSNCPNATGALDLSGCVSLSEVYLENTGFTGITFATGGLLKTAKLNAPTSLTMRDLIYLEDLTINSTNNITTLRVENCEFTNSAELTIGNTTKTQYEKDIVLNLIDSSPNLSRVRLVGVDWIIGTTDVLNRLLNMMGIDDDSYDISQSVLTGQVYTPSMRSGYLTRYNTTWEYLTITYDYMITQYLVSFVNADNIAILDRNGNAYTQWVDAGDSIYDPITMGYTITISGNGSPTDNEYSATSYDGDYYLDITNGIIYLANSDEWSQVAISDVLTPVKEQDAQYSYTYSGWDNISGSVYTARTVTATYTTTDRVYTVRWWSFLGGDLLETQTNLTYGDEAVYSGTYPTRTSGEAQLNFFVFKGWDKSTGYIISDLDVYGQWISTIGLPQPGTNTNDMNVAEIYGIGQNGAQDTFWDLDNDYIYKDITLGHDFNFTNVDSIEIGTDVELTGIARDTFVSGGYYFDGSSAYTTNIELFAEDSPSFTMAIDVQQSITSSASNTFVSADEGATNEFRIHGNGTAITVNWGGQTATVGNGLYRDIIVIRHLQGSEYMYVYSAGNATSRFADAVVKTTLMRSNSPNTHEPLTFGAVRYSNSYRTYGKGHVHWCKIWLADLGNEIAKQLAIYPRETIRFEYWGKNKYYYGDGGSTLCKSSWIANQLLGGVGGRGYYMNSTNTNAGGWKDSLMREWLNDRFYKALPIEWQSVIKPVEITSTTGQQSTAISQSYDKIYLPATVEIGGSTATGYISEIGAAGQANTADGKIPWFTSNAKRVKFKGKIFDYGGLSYSCAQDPAALYQTSIEPGTIWYDTSNSSVGYIFVSQDEIDQYGITVSKAASATYASGGWVSAAIWWERSPGLSASTGFLIVGTYGYAGSYGNASNVDAAAPGFSL